MMGIQRWGLKKEGFVWKSERQKPEHKHSVWRFKAEWVVCWVILGSVTFVCSFKRISVLK